MASSLGFGWFTFLLGSTCLPYLPNVLDRRWENFILNIWGYAFVRQTIIMVMVVLLICLCDHVQWLSCFWVKSAIDKSCFVDILVFVWIFVNFPFKLSNPLIKWSNQRTLLIILVLVSELLVFNNTLKSFKSMPLISYFFLCEMALIIDTRLEYLFNPCKELLVFPPKVGLLLVYIVSKFERS